MTLDKMSKMRRKENLLQKERRIAESASVSVYKMSIAGCKS